MVVVEAWAIPPEQFLSVAQVLDVAGLWATGDDMRMQAVAAAASLYMCTKLHDLTLERLDLQGTLSTTL